MDTPPVDMPPELGLLEEPEEPEEPAAAVEVTVALELPPREGAPLEGQLARPPVEVPPEVVVGWGRPPLATELKPPPLPRLVLDRALLPPPPWVVTGNGEVPPVHNGKVGGLEVPPVAFPETGDAFPAAPPLPLPALPVLIAPAAAARSSTVISPPHPAPLSSTNTNDSDTRRCDARGRTFVRANTSITAQA